MVGANRRLFLGCVFDGNDCSTPAAKGEGGHVARGCARVQRNDRETSEIKGMLGTMMEFPKGIQKVQVDNALAADMFTALSVDAATLGNEEGAKMLADAAAKYAAAALAEKKLELDRAAQATKEEQLRLARETFEAQQRREEEAKGTLADNALTDEDKVARMKEIFG